MVVTYTRGRSQPIRRLSEKELYCGPTTKKSEYRKVKGATRKKQENGKPRKKGSEGRGKQMDVVCGLEGKQLPGSIKCRE